MMDDNHSEGSRSFWSVFKLATDRRLREGTLNSNGCPKADLQLKEKPHVVDAGINGEGCITSEGVVVDEVRVSGSSPMVHVGKKLLLMALVGDEVPVELTGIIPVSVGIEG
jgi:hypothetical protein